VLQKDVVTFVVLLFFFGGKVKQKLEAKEGTEICMCQEGQEAQLQALPE